MPDLEHRVVARHRQAAAIVDTDETYRLLRQNLDKFDEHESLATRAQGLLAVLKKGAARQAWDDPEYQRARTAMDDLDSDLHQVELAVSYNFKLEFHRLWPLALEVLRRYSLSATLRKRVEALAKYWHSKQTVRVPRLPKSGWDRVDAIVTLYLKQVETVRSHIGVIGEALCKGRLISEGDAADPVKIKVGPFTLVNTGGFSEDVMQDVAQAVKAAADAASTSGFGKVCYGDVLVSQQISGKNTQAFYMPKSDEFFVRADAKRVGRTLHHILHELGHRMEERFLTGKLKAASGYLFMEVGEKHYGELEAIGPKPGEPFRDSKDGMDYVVDKVTDKMVHLRPQRTEAFLKDVRRRASRRLVQQGLRAMPGTPEYEAAMLPVVDSIIRNYKARISIDGWYQKKGIDPRRDKVDFKGYVTGYAATNSSENFAEMFAFYCLGELPPTQAALFERVMLDQDFGYSRG